MSVGVDWNGNELQKAVRSRYYCYNYHHYYEMKYNISKSKEDNNDRVLGLKVKKRKILFNVFKYT